MIVPPTLAEFVVFHPYTSRVCMIVLTCSCMGLCLMCSILVQGLFIAGLSSAGAAL